MLQRILRARTVIGAGVALVVALAAFGFTTQSTEAAPLPNAGGPYAGVAGQSIQFNASATINGSSYFWSFGDGTSAGGVAPVKAYAAAGTYTVTLTVTDVYGASASTVTTATITSSVYSVNPWYNALTNTWYATNGGVLYPTTVSVCPYGVVSVNGVLTCAAPVAPATGAVQNTYRRG